MKTSMETADDAEDDDGSMSLEDMGGGRRRVPAQAPPDRQGAMPGWVWALPRGPGCAGHARSVLAEALGSLGVSRDTVGDAQLMVSELATNAHQHASDHGPHELWLYLAEPEGNGHSAEVRCAVFDAHADAKLPGYSWTSGDCGRGLSIVRELSEGRWGMLRTLSRLGPSVPGKAVWFAVPAEVSVRALSMNAPSAPASLPEDTICRASAAEGLAEERG
ncbi:ATP-binding protein [Actinomadura barringtoniae]|uniref:ATP-binding protein n=1 Tax=Actinomadura barringtoniae TaxID=1427535 RepID=A0A939T4E4_9ACTN|nr:ATP-binding protein [Actinomadura barringtoniae]MBO2445807.1 ATP-binding protein [Actinomadura barringtoniae]